MLWRDPVAQFRCLVEVADRDDRAEIAPASPGNRASLQRFQTCLDRVRHGLAEGGVDYAMDDNNAPLVSDEMKAAVEAAKADIIAGKISVHDYMSDNNCPY